jgi:hypothetical protein
MTPTDKAYELISVFDKLLSERHYKPDVEVKLCALKSVDEIIKSRGDDSSFDDTSFSSSLYHTPHPMYLTYWTQVKQEIIKYYERRTL